ncbi:MAG: methylated-DNA--[protein]-cysteine S-methyltransferase [Chitinophagales bacterium]|nr:methylated-DNA--[protein]-cysteine S-methyltransferase [Chitinophagales bacterium]
MNSFISIIKYKSPLGSLLIGSFEDKICLCDWEHRKMRAAIDDRIQRKIGFPYQYQNEAIIEKTISQLEEYFARERTNFSIPISLIGTEFQQRVWNELLAIEYGKTISYLELANRLNQKLAIRAIATANGANAISILIPCHRIIGSDGSFVGYAGGIPAKKKLLEIEGSNAQRELFDYQ